MNETTPTGRIVSLTFRPGISKKPIVCNLSTLFGVCFNILRASISPGEEGHMVLELLGPDQAIRDGKAFLREQGVLVESVAHTVARNEASCVHCGLCTALCGPRALSVDPVSRMVLFEPERCTACGLCQSVCPVAAMGLAEDGAVYP